MNEMTKMFRMVSAFVTKVDSFTPHHNRTETEKNMCQNLASEDQKRASNFGIYELLAYV